MSGKPRTTAKHPRQKMAIGAFVGLGILLVAAPLTSASANSILRASVADRCSQNVPTACLWVDGKGGNNLMVMITSPDGQPDAPGAQKLPGLTPQFTDNISVGYNGLPFDLCLYDSSPENDRDSKSNWVTGKWMPVPTGGSFAQLEEYNDVFDRYTTADPGQCPQKIEFDNTTGEIFSNRAAS